MSYQQSIYGQIDEITTEQTPITCIMWIVASNYLRKYNLWEGFAAEPST